MPLEVVAILPVGLHTFSSPCRCPTQAGMAPVLPQALLFTSCHSSFILPEGCVTCSPLPGELSLSNWGFPSKSQQPQMWCWDPALQLAVELMLINPTLPTTEFVLQPGKVAICCTHDSQQCCTLTVGQRWLPGTDLQTIAKCRVY